MVTRLSAAVMTHPSRLAAAEALRDACPELAPAVVVDPEPDGPPSAARTALLAWAAVRPGATHHLVLQDDAVLAAGFARFVAAAVTARPADAVCLFTEWGSLTSCAMRLAAWRGRSWVEVCDAYTPTVALVLPAWAARCVAAAAPAAAQDDVVVAAVTRRLGLRTYATVPNLVEHGAPESLVGNGGMGLRRACCFADPADPPGPDWAAAPEPADLVPCLSRSYPRPFGLVRDGGTRSEWRMLTPTESLRRRGLPAPVGGAGRAAAGLVASHPDLRPDIAAGLWLTAWLAGVEAGPDAGRPLGHRALRTWGVGVFDQYLAAERLLAVAPALTRYTTGAFQAGRAAVL